jgi:hypothetical protein
MSEEALVNTSAVEWPSPDSAYFAVRRMQTKLHRWAGEDLSRRFGDLFNLVYDPAFLMHAWERVSTNAGARTAGIDQATVALIESRVGVEAFLGQIREALKSGAFVPVEVRRVMIPKGTSGKFRKLGIPTIADRVVQAAGWPGGISPPGSHRTERDSLPSLRSSHLICQNSGLHAQWANSAGSRFMSPFHQDLARLNALNRLNFLRAQRTR